MLVWLYFDLLGKEGRERKAFLDGMEEWAFCIQQNQGNLVNDLGYIGNGGNGEGWFLNKRRGGGFYIYIQQRKGFRLSGI